MRVLFWGTPEFALPSLRALLGEGHDVVGVVTRQDRPAGRGRKLYGSPVKAFAEEQAVPVLQPEYPRGDEFLEELRELDPEISVVAAYGRFLPAEVLDLPKRGSINVHPSLLPALRGAAPVQWALIRGHQRTGVSVIRLVEEMDAGPVLYQVAEPIEPDESASELLLRMAEIGAEALIEALVLMAVDALEPFEQDEESVTFAPPLERDDARIEWEDTATGAANWMRGLDAVPGGWTTYEGDVVKVFRPRAESDHEHDAAPGTILEADARDPDRGILVACGEGAVWVREVKPSGSRRMSTGDWLRGRGPERGERLGA